MHNTLTLLFGRAKANAAAHLFGSTSTLSACLLAILLAVMPASQVSAEESADLDPMAALGLDVGTDASSESSSTTAAAASTAGASADEDSDEAATAAQVQALLDNDAGLALSQEFAELISGIDGAVRSDSEPALDRAKLTNASVESLIDSLEDMDAAAQELAAGAASSAGAAEGSGAGAGAGSAGAGALQPEEILGTLEQKLAERASGITKDESLTSEEKERASVAIANAQKLLDEYETLLGAEQDFALEQAQARQLLPSLERNLAQANEIYTKEPPAIASTDLDVVSALADKLSGQLDDVQHELSQSTATYNTLQTLPSRNQNQILQNNERISLLQRQQDNLSGQSLLPDEQMVLPLEILVLQKQNNLLQEEIRALSLLQDVTNYKLHIFGLHKSYLEQYINLVHNYHSELLRQSMLNSEEEHSALSDKSEQPLLHSEFQYNQDFNSFIDRALSQQSQLQRALQEVNLALNTTEQIESNLQEQLSDLSGSVILSRLLNRQQGELPQVEISFNLDELIPNLNLWLFDLRGYREQIFDVQSYVGDMIAKHQELEPYRETLLQLIRQRRVLYEDLYNVLSDSLTTATELRNKYSELERKGREVRSLINDHLFWLTSNQGISLDFFLVLGPSLLQQGRELLDYLVTDFLNSENLFNYLKIFLPFAFLGLICFNTRHHFRRLNNMLAMRLDKAADGYLVTPLALFNHFFLIIPRVCLITILGSIVIFITLDQFSDQIMLTYYLSLHVICFLYMRHIMEPNSLEQRHFAVPPERLANSRVIIDQIWYISIPMLTIANMRELEPEKIPSDSIGYLLMLLGFIYLSIFACIQARHILLRENPSMSTLALILAGILTPLTISVMLGLGYYYTVIQLLNRVAFTLYLGFLYFILSQTLRRELHVAENKLTAYSRMQTLQTQFATFSRATTAPLLRRGGAAANKAVGTGKGSAAGFGTGSLFSSKQSSAGSLGFTSRLFSSTLQDSESTSARKSSNTLPRSAGAPRITATRLELISNRVFKLFNTFLLVFFLYFMYGQWSDLAGVLDYLNQIYLWQSSEVVDGKTIVSTLTLKDVLLATLIIVVTILLNRNLPLLVERVALLRANNNTKSISYTLRLITSYVITALGIVLAASALGISWDKLQWLVAALSVGLGFGLQEIFANFVSGIIILFERQIRVGDIVTLSGLSGTVSKIRIRATTIISFENMEVVIPNRQFITTALTNWSLSNTVTKIEFNIGIAYDADINKAKDLLRGILRRCRDINREKQPTVYVKSLDASAITLMCEVYVNEIGKRKAVFDFLSIEALRVFKENDIEVPFDQMDVTIRNLDTDEVLKFIAAQHGMKPEDIEDTFARVHRHDEEQAAAAAKAAAQKSSDDDTSQKNKDESDESVGSRLMRFIGIKSD